MLHEVLAKLSLVLLLQCVELALVSVEIVIVALLSQVTKNLGRWIVEVARSTVLVALVVSSFTLLLLTNVGGLGLFVVNSHEAFTLDRGRSLDVKRLLLL